MQKARDPKLNKQYLQM